MLASLKPERIRLAEFNMLEESFICVKAGSWSKYAALPGSTSTEYPMYIKTINTKGVH